MGKSKKVNQLTVIATTALLLGAGSAVDKTNADETTSVIEPNAVVQLQEETETSYEMVERLVEKGQITMKNGKYVFTKDCIEMMRKIIELDNDIPNSINGVELAISVKSLPKGGGVVSQVDITMKEMKDIQKYMIDKTELFISENDFLKSKYYENIVRNNYNQYLIFISSEEHNAESPEISNSASIGRDKLDEIVGVKNKKSGNNYMTTIQGEQYKEICKLLTKYNVDEVMKITNEKSQALISNTSQEEMHIENANEKYTNIELMTREQQILLGRFYSSANQNIESTEFDPDGEIAQEEFVNGLINLLNLDVEVIYQKTMSDDGFKQYTNMSGSPLEKEVTVLKYMGLIDYYNETEFNAEEKVTDKAMYYAVSKIKMRDETNMEDPNKEFTVKYWDLIVDDNKPEKVIEIIAKEQKLMEETEIIDDEALGKMEALEMFEELYELLNPEIK